MTRIATRRCLAALAFAAIAIPVLGQPSDGSADNVKAEQSAAAAAAMKALQKGPLSIKLSDQGSLAIPENFVFIPKAEAERFMKSLGNPVDPGLQGLVLTKTADKRQGLFEVEYHPDGHVKDDDARNLDADNLLDTIRKGTEEDNKRREQMGIPDLQVTGWVQKPEYEAARHQLVWCIGARSKGAPDGTSEGVNYRTLVLGRQGYVAMTLITDRQHIDQLRPAVTALLDGMQFETGKRYVDFDAGTDRVAEFGLAALITGVVAKKLGLFALIAAFLVKFAKVILVAVAAVLWRLRRKLGLGGKAPVEPAPAAPSLEPPSSSGSATPPGPGA